MADMQDEGSKKKPYAERVNLILERFVPGTDAGKRKVRYVVATISALYAIASLVLACLWEPSRKFFLCTWAVLPPVFFWFEYYYWFNPAPPPSELEQFKYGQEVSRNVWAGVLAVLIALKITEDDGVSKEQMDEMRQELRAATATRAELAQRSKELMNVINRQGLDALVRSNETQKTKAVPIATPAFSPPPAAGTPKPTVQPP